MMDTIEAIYHVIDNFSEEEFEAGGYIFTWKSVELLVARIRELEYALEFSSVFDPSFEVDE